MTLKKTINALNNWDVYEVIDKSLKDNEEQIVDFNILQHTEKGVYNTGIEINSVFEYAPLTIELKRASGTLTNNNPEIINLNDSGDYHNGYNIKRLNKKAWDIESTDSKADELDDNFNSGKNEIRGLTDENMAETEQIILKDIVDSLNVILSGFEIA